MAAPKVLSGARAKIGFLDPGSNQATFVGIFNTVSLGLSFDAQPAYILGRYSPADIDYTAQAPVSVNMSGYRVYGHGAHKDGRLPRLQDLLTADYLTVVIVDRQNPTRALHTIRNFRPTGYSTTISARNLEEISLSGVGILIDDEDTQNAESPGSMDLP